jgi:DNA-binding protein HU-beta
MRVCSQLKIKRGVPEFAFNVHLFYFELLFMSENIKKKEFVKLLAQKMKVSENMAEMWVDAFTETLYECFKIHRGVVITNLGTFYLRITSRGDSIFKFLPSQKLRALFGYSSTYKGNL